MKGCSLSVYPSAQHDDVFIKYAIDNLFAQPTASRPRLRHHQSWLEHRGTTAPAHEPSLLCLRALATTFFGTTHQDPRIIQRGSTLYGQALQMLNKRLGDPVAVAHVDILVDTMIMVVYELMILTVPHAWMYHAEGLGRLFQRLGPSAFTEPLTMDILDASRTLILLQCMIQRKHCFLADQKWQQVLRGQGRKADFLIQIHDLLCFVPGLMEQADQLAKFGTSLERHQRAKIVYQQILDCFHYVFEWRIRWQQENATSAVRQEDVSWISTREHNNTCFAINSSATTLLGIAQVHFACLHDATCIALYDATLLTLYRLMQAIPGGEDFKMSEGLPKVNNVVVIDKYTRTLLLPTSSDLHPTDVAIEICRTVDFHLSSEHRNMGSFNLIYPLRTAWSALACRPDIRLWISEILDTIARENTFKVGRVGASA